MQSADGDGDGDCNAHNFIIAFSRTELIWNSLSDNIRHKFIHFDDKLIPNFSARWIS